VSVYVHTGQEDSPKQDEKYRFLDAMTQRLAQLSQRERVLVAGDFNIAHTERDIKNAKGNRGKSGFLEGEREYLTDWLQSGWVDIGREHAGDVDGPYTWWTWRGQAFDRDVGWRIDYMYTTPALAKELSHYSVGRAPSYAERWSDHAPVSAHFG
jgi:exodeoxyribonuclease III